MLYAFTDVRDLRTLDPSRRTKAEPQLDGVLGYCQLCGGPVTVQWMQGLWQWRHKKGTACKGVQQQKGGGDQ